MGRKIFKPKAPTKKSWVTKAKRGGKGKGKKQDIILAKIYQEEKAKQIWEENIDTETEDDSFK